MKYKKSVELEPSKFIFLVADQDKNYLAPLGPQNQRYFKQVKVTF